MLRGIWTWNNSQAGFGQRKYREHDGATSDGWPQSGQGFGSGAMGARMTVDMQL